MANKIEIQNLFKERVNLELKVKKSLYDFIKQVQGEKEFIELSDDTSFFDYHFDDNDFCSRIIAIKVKDDKFLFFDDNSAACEISNEAYWFDPYLYGSFDDESLFWCVLEYADLNGIGID